MFAPAIARVCALSLLAIAPYVAAQEEASGGACTSTASWLLCGNAIGTEPVYLGTNEQQPLVMKTDGMERMRIGGNGYVAVSGNANNPLINPGQALHIGDGNMLIEGGGETALMFKRDVSFVGTSGTLITDPTFMFGRIIQAGDQDPEVRVLYQSQTEPERAVFEFDRKGIVASVKPDVGSHFEGFVVHPYPEGKRDTEPRFRLNSYPSMQLEMGPGGNVETDVMIRRAATKTLTVLTGGTERMRLGPKETVAIATGDPESALHVAGYIQVAAVTGQAPPASDCAVAEHAGRMIVRTDGPPHLYVCPGAAGWVGQ